jgi:hypothetical protein
VAIVGVLLALAFAASRGALGALEHAQARRQPDPLVRISTLTRSLEWNPSATLARRDRARAFVAAAAGALREPRLLRAREDYGRVLDQRPLWAEAWYELAWVELARGDPGAARAAVVRASTLDPTSEALRKGSQALLARIEADASSR